MDEPPRSIGAPDRDMASALERLAQLYAARNQIGRVVARVPSRDELFQHVCRILVDSGGFRMAWIGWYDAPSEQLQIAARYGRGSEELLSRPLTVTSARGGPTARAFRERRVIICNDLPNDPDTVDWRAEITRRGLGSGAAFPVIVQDEVRATLSVYAAMTGHFQEKETALLAETAGDLAFALDNLAREAHRLEADAAARTMAAQLERERARLQEAQEIASIGNWELDLRSGVVAWSAEMYRIFGTSPSTFAPGVEPALHLVYPADREMVARAFADSIAAAPDSDSRVVIEHRIITPHGLKVVEVGWRVFRDDDGRPARALGTCRDITVRHDADVRIRRLNRTYAMLSAVSKAIVYVPAPEDVLRAFCDIAVAVGGFPMAWVGMADADRRHVTPVASAGVVEGYLDALSVDRGNPAQSMQPIALALDTGKHVICNDIAKEAGLAWRDRALSHGYRASAAFPILKHGAAVGVFTLYAADIDFFDDEEARLLDGLARDIGFALEVHEREMERRRTETLLTEREAEVRESIAELRVMTHRLYEIKEEERARIARDLHDHLGQALTALKMDVAEVGRRLGTGDLPTVRERLRDMSSLVDEAVQDMRRVASALRPASVDELGLLEAIRLYLHDVERRGGPVCSLTARAEAPIRKDLALVAFRILQEAVTNVLRHAGATHVDVLVESDAAAMLRLVIRDNGRGLPPDAGRRAGTLGLVGMRDRARLIDGDVTISSAPGEGTTVAARIPLELQR